LTAARPKITPCLIFEDITPNPSPRRGAFQGKASPLLGEDLGEVIMADKKTCF